jgi:threonine dehydrogenase-like Zn-dependent dehydrogenase
VCVCVCARARGTFHLERAAVNEGGVARLQEGDRVCANKSCGRCDEATEDGGQKCELHLSTLMVSFLIGFVSRRRPVTSTKCGFLKNFRSDFRKR